MARHGACIRQTVPRVCAAPSAHNLRSPLRHPQELKTCRPKFPMEQRSGAPNVPPAGSLGLSSGPAWVAAPDSADPVGRRHVFATLSYCRKLWALCVLGPKKTRTSSRSASQPRCNADFVQTIVAVEINGLTLRDITCRNPRCDDAAARENGARARFFFVHDLLYRCLVHGGTTTGVGAPTVRAHDRQLPPAERPRQKCALNGGRLAIKKVTSGNSASPPSTVVQTL